MMNKAEFLAELEKAFSLDKGTLTPDVALEGIKHWDSMAVLEFQALADEQFGIQVDPSAISDCKTVDDLCKMVNLGSDA